MSDPRLCRQLVERADLMRQQDPRRAVSLADAARALASSVDRRRMHRGSWRALQAEAWGAMSGALRALGEGDAAESTLNVAIAFVEAEARAFDPTLPPRLAQRAAHLRAGQERYREALSLIDEAVHELSSLGRHRLLATALVDRAVILGAAGRKRLAVRALRKALEGYGASMSRRTRLAAVHNVAVFLHEAARTPKERREALHWLRLAMRLHEAVPASVERHKLRALCGLTALELGLLDEGFAALWSAYAAFSRLGIARQRASILLDIAQSALRFDRRDELRTVAGEMFGLRRAFSAERSCWTALGRLHRALQRGGLTPGLIARTAEAVGTGESRR